MRLQYTKQNVHSKQNVIAFKKYRFAARQNSGQFRLSKV